MADQNFDCGKCMKDTCFGLFVKFPIMVFSWVMLGIGSVAMTKESRDCPSAIQLPVILIVGGTLVVVFTTWKQFLEKCCGCCADKMEERNCKVAGKSAKFGLELGYNYFMLNACILWTVISSIYVANNVAGSPFTYWKDALGDKFDEIAASIEGEEANISQDNQDLWLCSNDVYNMSILSIIMGYILSVLIAIFGVAGMFCKLICCKPCQDSTEGTVNNA